MENENKSKLIPFGALWKKKDKNGETFLSGKLKDERVIFVFKNVKRPDKKDPDFNLFIASSDGAKEPGDDLDF